MHHTHEFLERDRMILAALTQLQRHSLERTFSSHALEGFEPTSEHVAIAASFVRGDIDGDAYLARMAAMDGARISHA